MPTSSRTSAVDPASESLSAEIANRPKPSLEHLGRMASVCAPVGWALLCVLALIWTVTPLPAFAQSGSVAKPKLGDVGGESTIDPTLAPRFMPGRVLAGGGSAAAALESAWSEHLAMVNAQAKSMSAEARTANSQTDRPRLNPLSVAWQAMGPGQVASQSFGLLSGRVTSIAIDPADSTGNTIYAGTTGGGVWKSTNAAGPSGSVTFTPLTDTLPVYSANVGTAVIPSLSIGAMSVSNGVVLAGTGDPNDASDSYYGSGLLRSVDGGATWTLINQSLDGVTGNHSFVGLGVAGFAWSTASPNLVVAAISQAAEGVIVNAVDQTNSVMGLYYSMDAGVTWQMALIEDGTQVVQRPEPTGRNLGGNAATAVVWNAVRQRFYAAVRFHGYYESVDGVTFTRLAHQPGTALTMTACPTNPDGIGNSGCPLFRGVLAVQAVTGDTFALTVNTSDVDEGLWQDVCGITGTGCAASPIAFGKQLASAPLEVGSGSTAIFQGDYNLSLAAVSTGMGAGADTILFAGTVDLYRCSLAGGCVLRNTTNSENGCSAPAMVSPAQHAIAVLAGGGTGGTLPLVYLGNDGGVWRSMDGVNQQQTPCSADDATHFQNLNGGLGSLAEVISLAGHPTDASTLLAGLGASGTVATGSASTSAPWPQISAGEGGTVAIDQTNPQNWYVSTAAGVSIRYCAKGTGCAAADFAGAATIGYGQVKNDASAIDPPFVLDPAMLSNVVIGTCRVWRGPTQSGSSWPGSNEISTLLGGPQNATCSGTTNPILRSLGAGGPGSGAVAARDAGSTVLYAGMAGPFDGGGNFAGHVFANYAAGTASSNTVWTDISMGPVTNDVTDVGVFNPGGFDISSVVADVHDATGKTVYATAMGFAGNGVNAPHVYRSIDGGAHWTNISSNLPNAPASGMLIDPNDANTLYVAMDTGVYVTTQVATCTSANCWSVFGTQLPNAPVIALAAGTGIPTGDGRFGELRVATYGRGIWEIPLLTAAYPATPLMSLSPTSLTFDVQAVATASAAKTITVTNSGSASLTVTQLAITGDFTETDNCVGSAVAPGGSCAVQVEFQPTKTGTRTGLLTVYGNVAGGQATAALSGVATPPAAIILTPLSVVYLGTNVGSTSTAQNITISNIGGLPATLQTANVTGDFKITANTCGPSLGSNVGCTVAVAFVPTASGTRTGSFSMTDSAGTQVASLTGLGVLQATDSLTPLTLSFAAQQLNTVSVAQQVTLTNSGDAALTLIGAQIVSGDFTVVNGCGNSLNGHSSCSMLVAFVPKSVGTGTGVLTVSDQFRTQSVTLNGVGVAPAGVSLSPFGAVTFSALGVGLTSAGRVVTLTNNGGLPLAIQSIGVLGDFTLVAGSNTCGTTLAAGSACTAQVAFAPTMGGVRTGSVSVVDNAAGSPQNVVLTGTGVDFALTANGNTTATLTAGQQAVYPLLLSSSAGVPGTVMFTCSPVPAHATCYVNPASVALGGTTTITVTVATSVAGAALHWPGERPILWLAGLVPFGLLAVGRRRLRVLGLLGCLLAVAGCGVSRVIPLTSLDTGSGGGTAAPTPTPSGTYNLVVSGTSAGLTRTVGLTLIVQ